MRRAVLALLWALLLIPAVIEIAGFRSAHLLSQEIWPPIGLHHLARFTALFAAIFLPAAVLLRRYLFSIFAAAIVIGSIAAVGVPPVASVLFFIFSAAVLGRLIFGREIEARLAFMAGLAVWILAMTLTSRLPLHYAAVYWVALVLPLFAAPRESARLASEWLRLFRPRAISLPEAAAFLLLAFLMAAHWLAVLKPEASTDGLAVHLAIPAGMARFHFFNFDFRRYVWALMPLGSDFCYSVLYILGGEYAARLLNFALLASIAALLHGEARRLASRAIALFIAALFVSTPLVQLVTGSMFVENFVAAMCLAGAVALWRYREFGTTRYLLLAMFLLATAISLKLAAFAIAILALPFLWGAMPKPRVAVLAAAGFLAVASLPYLYAWWRSGNPIFPYANATFHSPYVGNDLVDVRFHPPLSWTTPIRLTLYTHDYFEGQNGTFGFQYLLLLPLTLACVLARRRFTLYSAVAIGAGAAVIVAVTQPNARYFYSALPFLSIGAAATLSWLQAQYKPLFVAAVFASVAAALANVYFLPASNYHHRDFYSSPLLRASGRQEYLQSAAPVREVIAYLNRTAPTEPVFYADGSQIAGLLAPAYRNSWHDYAFMKQVDGCASPRELYQRLASRGVRHMIIDRYVTERQASVAGLISACGDPEFHLGNFSALKLNCKSRAGFQPAAGF